MLVCFYSVGQLGFDQLVKPTLSRDRSQSRFCRRSFRI